MRSQLHSWYQRLWHILTRWLHTCPPVTVTLPDSISQTITVTQWALTDHHNSPDAYSTSTEVELIMPSTPRVDDPALRITHYPSERLH